MTRADWLYLLSVVVAGCVAYHNSFAGAFLLDDLPWIVHNPDLQVLWPPTVAMGESFRPLAFYSLAVNRAISGDNVWSYHALTLLLHLLAALTLYGLVRRTLRLPRVGASGGGAARIAVAVSLIWVVHPLNSQAVTYIVQRSEVMMALAYLFTLYGLVRAIDADSDRSRRAWLAASVLAFYAGLGCKEVIATAPLTLYLFDAVAVSGSFAAPFRRRAAFYGFLIAPFLVVPAVWLATNPARFVLLAPSAGTPATFDYVWPQGRVLIEYLRLALWPLDLNFDHCWHPADHASTLLPSFVVVSALLVVTIEALRRRAFVGWIGAAFFLVLAPSSSFFPLGDYMVEHRMYLALIPCVVAAVLGCHAVLRRAVRPSGARRIIAWVLVATTTSGLVALTVQRNAVYSDPMRMWSDVVAKSPKNPRAQFNLGLALLPKSEASGGQGPALRHFLHAAELMPTHVKAHTNAGTIYFFRSRYEKAAEHYRAALLPGDVAFDLLNNYGSALQALHRHARAVAVFERALDQLAREPEQHAKEARLRNNLGFCYAHLGVVATAVEHVRRAVELDPDLKEARTNLVRMLVALQAPTLAVERCRSASEQQPESFDVRLRLARALAAHGLVGEAIPVYLDALALDPSGTSARVELARLHVVTGDREGATRQFREALRRDPSIDEATDYLESLR